jgi:hypothetical protein
MNERQNYRRLLDGFAGGRGLLGPSADRVEQDRGSFAKAFLLVLICLSSPICKNISVFIEGKSPAYYRHPVPREGRWPSSLALGRGAVDADALLTNGAEAYGKVVWS